MIMEIIDNQKKKIERVEDENKKLREAYDKV